MADTTNFVNYNDAQELMTAVGNKFRALNGAYVIRGNSAFANLPTVLTKAMNGFVYNVTDEFTTTANFVEGAGKKYPAGTNVVIADIGAVSYSAVTPEGTENPSTEGWYELDGTDYVLTTDTTVDGSKTYYEAITAVNMKYDVIGEFVDVDAINDNIQAVSDMITGEFDETQEYAANDVVVYEGKLYQFKDAHTADDPWDADNVDERTVVELISSAEPASLTTEQINALIALLD